MRGAAMMKWREAGFQTDSLGKCEQCAAGRLPFAVFQASNTPDGKEHPAPVSGNGAGRNTGDLSCKRSRHHSRCTQGLVKSFAFRGRGSCRASRCGTSRSSPWIQERRQTASRRHVCRMRFRHTYQRGGVSLAHYAEVGSVTDRRVKCLARDCRNQRNASANDITRGVTWMLKPANTFSIASRLEAFSAAVQPSKMSEPAFWKCRSTISLPL